MFSNKSVEMVKNTYFILIFSLLVYSCSSKKDSDKNIFKKEDLLGTWSLHEWVMYHTLKIDNSQIYVDNNIDSVFYLRYKIKNGYLIIWDEDSTHINKAKIIRCTQDSLILRNFLKGDILRYSREH